METQARRRRMTAREQERIIQKVFELRLQLMALVARLLQNGIEAQRISTNLERSLLVPRGHTKWDNLSPISQTKTPRLTLR